MQNILFEFSPIAAAFFSSLLFWSDVDKITAVIFAVMVHELSHLLSLAFFKFRISSFQLSLKGLCIRYTGSDRTFEKTFSNMAGPVGGLTLFFVGELCADCCLPEWLYLSCRVSLFLSLFNVMPVYPLDGGYATYAVLSSCLNTDVSDQIIRCFGLCFSVFLIFSGLFILMSDNGFGISIAGVWLLCANISHDDL